VSSFSVARHKTIRPADWNASLNLTVANCVHLVEPQWNPAVEEQAVARVLRIGQTREVTVFRYVTMNTIEQVSREPPPSHAAQIIRQNH
jgi:SNF2 family DNA or RNA helicase